MQGISYEKMANIVEEYVHFLTRKYPYWNRTLGADHFFVTCHDVGVRATSRLAYLVKNAIRVVCSPSYNGSFIPHKDVAMPQILQPFPLPPGGNDIENRLASLKPSTNRSFLRVLSRQQQVLNHLLQVQNAFGLLGWTSELKNQSVIGSVVGE